MVVNTARIEHYAAAQKEDGIWQLSDMPKTGRLIYRGDKRIERGELFYFKEKNLEVTIDNPSYYLVKVSYQGTPESYVDLKNWCETYHNLPEYIPKICFRSALIDFVYQKRKQLSRFRNNIRQAESFENFVVENFMKDSGVEIVVTDARFGE